MFEVNNRSGVSIVNFEHILHLSRFSIVDFEQENARCVKRSLAKLNFMEEENIF